MNQREKLIYQMVIIVLGLALLGSLFTDITSFRKPQKELTSKLSYDHILTGSGNDIFILNAYQYREKKETPTELFVYEPVKFKTDFKLDEAKVWEVTLDWKTRGKGGQQSYIYYNQSSSAKSEAVYSHVHVPTSEVIKNEGKLLPVRVKTQHQLYDDVQKVDTILFFELRPASFSTDANSIKWQQDEFGDPKTEEEIYEAIEEESYED